MTPIDPAAIEAELNKIERFPLKEASFSRGWLIATCRALLAELGQAPRCPCRASGAPCNDNCPCANVNMSGACERCCIPDDPAADGTDAAHPAWWRGRANGVACVVEKLREAMDGEDDGAGVCADPALERLRRNVLAARAAIEVAETAEKKMLPALELANGLIYETMVTPNIYYPSVGNKVYIEEAISEAHASLARWREKGAAKGMGERKEPSHG